MALAIVGVACILVGGGIFAMLYFSNVGPFKDSGLAMCESIRDGQDAGSASDSDSPLTEAEYLELRAQFANSRYADIRDAGTRFVDLVWQLSSVDDDDSLGAALLFAGQIMEAYSALSGACAAHGVVIPPLSAN